MTLTSLVPLPYRILALVVLSIALFAAGVVQGMKVGEAELDRWQVAQQKATISAMAAAAAKTRAYQAQKDGALHDAQVRAQSNARAAAAARTESDGLRGDLAQARRDLSDAPADAVRRYAAATSVVFEQCVDRYTAVARDATGHASDSLMLQDAWPKQGTPR